MLKLAFSGKVKIKKRKRKEKKNQKLVLEFNVYEVRYIQYQYIAININLIKRLYHLINLISYMKLININLKKLR
jgi:hypothetical protein